MNFYEAVDRAIDAIQLTPLRLRLFAAFVLLTLPFWLALAAVLHLKDSDFGAEVRVLTVGAFRTLRTGLRY